MKSNKPAVGTTGHLIYTGSDYYFRVYDDSTEPSTFVDYGLRHSDLMITIVDHDSAFYTDTERPVVNRLDHSPMTLGIFNYKQLRK